MIGRLVDGKFRILSVLGTGGFGTVYKADQVNLDRTIALKVLDPTGAEFADLKARFEREATILSSLHHPNIVSAISFGVMEDGRQYIAMQYLEGRSLAQLLQEERRLDWKRAVHIGAQLSQACATAHAHGIAHRDLKPQNVMLVDDPVKDTVKVLDFGLARMITETSALAQKLTQTGQLIGTVQYMSPEVCRGHAADQRSDIYSLGCILYECLAGCATVEGEDPLEVLYKQASELPPRLQGKVPVPEQLERLVFKCIQKNPDARFRTMTDVQEALALIASGHEKQLDLDDVRLPKSPSKIANGRLKTTLLIAMTCLAGLGGGFWWQWQKAQKLAGIGSTPHQRPAGLAYTSPPGEHEAIVAAFGRTKVPQAMAQRIAAINRLPSERDRVNAYAELVEQGLSALTATERDQLLMTLKDRSVWCSVDGSRLTRGLAVDYAMLLRRAVLEGQSLWSDVKYTEWTAYANRRLYEAFSTNGKYDETIYWCREQIKFLDQHASHYADTDELGIAMSYLPGYLEAAGHAQQLEAAYRDAVRISERHHMRQLRDEEADVAFKLRLATFLLSKKDATAGDIAEVQRLIEKVSPDLPYRARIGSTFNAPVCWKSFLAAYKLSGRRLPAADRAIKLVDLPAS